MAGVRIRTGWSTARLLAGCLILLVASMSAGQDWQKVHKADDAKWAKATGLDPFVIHKIWKAASASPDEKLDESRIANLDVQGLAARHDVLLATYSGAQNCLKITVFRQLSSSVFRKLWSVEQPPDGTGFCDTDFGTASNDVNDGVITVSVPRSRDNGDVVYTVYAYEWNGLTYRFAGQKDVKGR